MKKCNEIKGIINSIESYSTIDGPGIRCVIFLSGCNKRCKFCHNPEMWQKVGYEVTPKEIVAKVLKFKPYFGQTGGVTFSGGEALLQLDFLYETAKLLKKEKINIAVDTAGINNKDVEKIFKYIDLFLLDIKHIDEKKYKELTKVSIDEQETFIELLNKNNKKVWIRQVITPGITDTKDYIKELKDYIKKIKNIEKIDFIPYHTLGVQKYEKLGIDYPLKGLNAMDKEECENLYKYFTELD